MVGMYCAMPTCRNCYEKVGKDLPDSPRVSFHSFPRERQIREKWVQLCNRSDKFNPDNSFICSDHFQPEDFIRDLRAELLGDKPKRKLHPGTLPSRNIPNEPRRPKTDLAVRRKERMKRKKEQKVGDPAHEVALECDALEEVDVDLGYVIDSDTLSAGICDISSDEELSPNSESKQEARDIIKKEAELRIARITEQMVHDKELHDLKIKEAKVKLQVAEAELELIKLKEQLLKDSNKS